MPLDARPDTPIASDSSNNLPNEIINNLPVGSLVNLDASSDSFNLASNNNEPASIFDAGSPIDKDGLSNIAAKLEKTESRSLPRLTQNEADQIRRAVSQFCPPESLPEDLQPNSSGSSRQTPAEAELDPSIVAQYITPENISALLHNLPKPWPPGLVNQSIMAFLESQDNQKGNTTLSLALEDLRSQLEPAKSNLASVADAKVKQQDKPVNHNIKGKPPVATKRKTSTLVPKAVEKSTVRVTVPWTKNAGASKPKPLSNNPATETTDAISRFEKLKLKAQTKLVDAKPVKPVAGANAVSNAKDQPSPTTAENEDLQRATRATTIQTLDVTNKKERLSLKDRLERNKLLLQKEKSTEYPKPMETAITRSNDLALETAAEPSKRKTKPERQTLSVPSNEATSNKSKEPMISSSEATTNKSKEPMISSSEATSNKNKEQMISSNEPKAQSSFIKKNKVPAEPKLKAQKQNASVESQQPAFYGYAWPAMQIYYSAASPPFPATSAPQQFDFSVDPYSKHGKRANKIQPPASQMALPIQLIPAGVAPNQPLPLNRHQRASWQAQQTPFPNAGQQQQPLMVGYYNINNGAIASPAFYPPFQLASKNMYSNGPLDPNNRGETSDFSDKKQAMKPTHLPAVNAAVFAAAQPPTVGYAVQFPQQYANQHSKINVQNRSFSYKQHPAAFSN